MYGGRARLACYPHHTLVWSGLTLQTQFSEKIPPPKNHATTDTARGAIHKEGIDTLFPGGIEGMGRGGLRSRVG
jgi:hypothetical protein